MNSLSNWLINWRLGATVFVITSALLTWLFVGMTYTYADHEFTRVFFLKKYPTVKIEFANPDEAEDDYLPFAELSSEKREAITAYCKFRFGVVSAEIAKIEECRQHTFDSKTESR
jgi:hypothetical protein